MVQRMGNVSIVRWRRRRRRRWVDHWVVIEMCRMVSCRVMVTLGISCNTNSSLSVRWDGWDILPKPASWWPYLCLWPWAW